MARLQLTEEEIRSFTPQIESILTHVAELQKIDIDGVEPLLSPVSLLSEGARADAARSEELQHKISQEVLRCAPDARDGALLVPPVL